jgi:ABC-type tungstate transport system substrate-binding protein
MRFARPLLNLLRLLAAVLVILGIGFWTGRWAGLIPVHRAIGSLFVLTLWAIAALALKERRAARLAIIAIIWGVVVAEVGFMQQRILIGDLHWIVRVLHLAIAVASMPIAERMTRAGAGSTRPQLGDRLAAS